MLAESTVLTVDEFPQIKAQVEGIDVSALETATAEAALPDEAPAGEEQAAADWSDPVAAAGPPQRFGLLRALDERGNVRALADVEGEMIKLAVDRYNGQMSEVARRLGIGRSTLYRKLKELGIDPDEGRSERLAS